MRRSRASIDAALVAASDAVRATIRTRPRTWRADLDALRRTVQTLSAALREAPVDERPSAIGFDLDTETQWEDPEHGCDADYEHDADAPTAPRVSPR